MDSFGELFSDNRMTSGGNLLVLTFIFVNKTEQYRHYDNNTSTDTCLYAFLACYYIVFTIL